MIFQLSNEGTGEIFYATTQSAGFDLCANESKIIEPSQWALIKTGLRIVESCGAQPIQFGKDKVFCVPEIQIRPRSGLALKHGITVLNSPSTIDADYRGEIMITLINHGKVPFSVNIGERIAQAVCALAVQLDTVKIKNVERGTGGFGSTG